MCTNMFIDSYTVYIVYMYVAPFCFNLELCVSNSTRKSLIHIQNYTNIHYMNGTHSIYTYNKYTYYIIHIWLYMCVYIDLRWASRIPHFHLCLKHISMLSVCCSQSCFVARRDALEAEHSLGDRVKLGGTFDGRNPAPSGILLTPCK